MTNITIRNYDFENDEQQRLLGALLKLTGDGYSFSVDDGEDQYLFNISIETEDSN